MNLGELVGSLLGGDTLGARQWVIDARRARFQWAREPRPTGLDPVGVVVAAGLAEMLAIRAGQVPPDWVHGIGPAPSPIYLVKAALSMPRLRRTCQEEGPEPLRRRAVLAPPEFLTVA